MDFRKLESFVSIVKFGSFTKAAEELYLTQPTITGHIQSLEKELGTVLFNRGGKTISLTETGQLLFGHALNILSTREQALFSLAEYEGKLKGDLSIAASTVPQKHLLPNLLATFSIKYPQITFTIKQFDSDDVVDGLLSGMVDFGFIGKEISLPELETIRLCQGDLVVVTPDCGKYREFKKTTLTWDDLKNENFILREEGSANRNLFLQCLEKMGVNVKGLRIVATIENPDTIKECVMAGLGIAVVSELQVKEELRLGLLRGFQIAGLDVKQQFYFVSHKNRVLSPIARAFRAFIDEYFSVL